MSNTEAKIEPVKGLDATYSLLDRKFRLYPGSPLEAGVRELIKNAGFEWDPKREAFVGYGSGDNQDHDDFCLAIAGEIEPECLKAAYDCETHQYLLLGSDIIDADTRERIESEGFVWDAEEGAFVGYGNKDAFCRSLAVDIDLYEDFSDV